MRGVALMIVVGVGALGARSVTAVEPRRAPSEIAIDEAGAIAAATAVARRRTLGESVVFQTGNLRQFGLQPTVLDSLSQLLGDLQIRTEGTTLSPAFTNCTQARCVMRDADAAIGVRVVQVAADSAYIEGYLVTERTKFTPRFQEMPSGVQRADWCAFMSRARGSWKVSSFDFEPVYGDRLYKQEKPVC